MYNSTALRYGWQFEMNNGLEAVHTVTTFIDIFCTFPVQIWVLNILTLKPSVLRNDIRLSYMADQITMILYGLVTCILLRPYPTFPWPGLFYSGIMCQLDIDQRLIAVNIKLHNFVSVGSDTKFIISGRSQVVVMLVITVLLLFNAACFSLTCIDAENSDQLKKASGTFPELAILAQRKGTLIVIGFPGNPAQFPIRDSLTLFNVFRSGCATNCAHSSLLINNQAQSSTKSALLSNKTQQVQDRLAVVFYLQIFSVFFFFVIPMLGWVCLTAVDTRSWSDSQLILLRIWIIIALTLKPLAQSLIFLGKNRTLREKSLDRMRTWCTTLFAHITCSSKSSVHQNAVAPAKTSRETA